MVSSLKAIDFVDKLLRYDHLERPTAKEAMVKYSPMLKDTFIYDCQLTSLYHLCLVWVCSDSKMFRNAFK